MFNLDVDHIGVDHFDVNHLGVDHMNPFLWVQSQKTEIGPDSIIDYFVFTKILKWSECSKTTNKHF